MSYRPPRYGGNSGNNSGSGNQGGSGEEPQKSVPTMSVYLNAQGTFMNLNEEQLRAYYAEDGWTLVGRMNNSSTNGTILMFQQLPPDEE